MVELNKINLKKQKIKKLDRGGILSEHAFAFIFFISYIFL
jgi:hypothetical protein